MSHSLVF